MGFLPVIPCFASSGPKGRCLAFADDGCRHTVRSIVAQGGVCCLIGGGIPVGDADDVVGPSKRGA